MRATILTEGSSKIGLGHLSRCFALYQALEEQGASVRMGVYGDEYARMFLPDALIELGDWKKSSLLERMLGQQDMVIVDSYLADQGVFQKIFDEVRSCAFLDDTVRLEYPEAFIINGAINAGELGYGARDEYRLLGMEYALMRHSFWEVPLKKVHQDVNDILITFGGEDIRHMSGLALQTAKKVYPESNIHLVIGAACQNREKLMAFQSPDIRIYESLPESEMYALMLGCDLCVSAGGMTLFELARVGIPTVAVQVAENQINNLKGFGQCGFLDSWVVYDSEELESVLQEKLQRLRFPDIRKKHSCAGQGSVDGQGARRVVQRLLDHAGVKA